MFDTIINIIQIGHLIGLLVLIVLYFTTPYILRKYVFTSEEGNDDESHKIDDPNVSVEDLFEKENEEDQN